MESIKTIMLGILILILAPGCNKSNSGSTSSPDLFPNKFGDRWQYLVKDTTIQGNQESGSTQYTVNVVVVGTVQWSNGINASIWQVNYPDRIDTNFVFQSGDTIKFLDRTGKLLIRQYIIPFHIGSSWPYIPGYPQVTVVGEGPITSGSNTFAGAWEIYGMAGFPDGSFFVDESFADHVGFVRKYLNPSGELIYTKHIEDWLLESYDLK
jgi:hypothetical protein